MTSLITEATLVPKATRSIVLEGINCLSDKQKQATSSLKANGMKCGWPRVVSILEEKDRCRNGCLIGRMILKVWGSFTFLFGNLMDKFACSSKKEYWLGVGLFLRFAVRSFTQLALFVEFLDEHLDCLREGTAILEVAQNFKCAISQNQYFECAKFQDLVITDAVVYSQGKIKRANSSD